MLPAIRLTYLRTTPAFAEISRQVKASLTGKSYLLPTELGEYELGLIVDALALLTDLPVLRLGSASQDQPALWLADQSPPTDLPVPPQSIMLSSRTFLRNEGTAWNLSLPHVLLEINRALAQISGLALRGQSLAQWSPWSLATLVADTPATWLAAMNGMAMLHIAHPSARLDEQVAAAVVSALRSMLIGVDARVVEWMIVLASRDPSADSWLSTAASQLGRREALRQAFSLGLLTKLERPELLGTMQSVEVMATFRRPLRLLGQLDETPGTCTLAQIMDGLRPHLPVNLATFFYRSLHPYGAAPLVPLPELPKFYVARSQILDQLMALLEPGTHVRTTILCGDSGSGKSTLAADLARSSVHQSTPVWVSFVAGPDSGWLPVAVALGLDHQLEPTEDPNPAVPFSSVPAWVERVLQTLAKGPFLVVVEDLQGVEETALDNWLPAGLGPCRVLLLSESPLPILERERDAVTVHVPRLTLEESRNLLGLVWPGALPILDGASAVLLRGLDRCPLDIRLVALALQHVSDQEWMQLQKLSASGGQSPLALRQKLWKAVLDRQFSVLDSATALATGAAESTRELIEQIIGSESTYSGLGLLESAGIVRTRGQWLRLHPALRWAMTVDASSWARHGHAVSQLFAKNDPSRRTLLFDSLIQAAAQVPVWYELDPESAHTVLGQLEECPSGVRQTNLIQVLESDKALLKKNLMPEQRAFIQAQHDRLLGQLPLAARPFTRPGVRALLERVLRTAADLEAFMIDHFPHVAWRLTAQMDTNARQTLLLSEIPLAQIVTALRQEAPVEVARHEAMVHEHPVSLTGSPTEPNPTRELMLHLLTRIFPGDPSFDAFCFDHFPEVYSRYSPGVDGLSKRTMLLDVREIPSIYQALREWYPDKLKKAWSLPQRSPSPKMIRSWINRLLRDHQELSHFLESNFPNFVSNHTIHGQSRTELLNTLLREVDGDEIQAALHRGFPDQVPSESAEADE